jgi:hypothetical protein
MADVEAGIAEGWIRRGSGAGLQDVKRVRSGRGVLDALGEDRGE